MECPAECLQDRKTLEKKIKANCNAVSVIDDKIDALWEGIKSKVTTKSLLLISIFVVGSVICWNAWNTVQYIGILKTTNNNNVAVVKEMATMSKNVALLKSELSSSAEILGLRLDQGITDHAESTRKINDVREIIDKYHPRQ